MVYRRLLNDGNQSGNDVSPSILITVLILAIAVIISASLYLLLRFIRRHNHQRHRNRTPHPPSSRTRHVITRRVTPSNKTHNPLVDALPLFTSESLKTTGDCAVCLSKFEKDDLLRLLPICCHVFHADCIDTWLISNQSCPLCRSPVFQSDSELLPKLAPEHDTPSISSGTFRVEIGNVSRRNDNNSGEIPVRRSYSLGGNFDYVVDDDVVSEVHSGSFRRTSSTSEFKVDSDTNSQQQQQQGNLAAEVGTRGGGGWLKDYLTHSLSSSFRSSGRWFFTGSSRRETTTTTNEYGASEMDMEASQLGDEIGELFRWLSGV